jgi:peptidoglycan/xylan/chitin deacetylase (PgdA/CDA1 family)
MMKTENSAMTGNTWDHPAAPVPSKASGKASIARVVTTSWDDGDPSDLKVAEMLAARQVPGTFYIPVKGHVMGNHRASRMSLKELRELSSQGFEIGAHGVSHPNLPECSSNQLLVEVDGGKKRLEDDLGQRIAMFAYPRGRHSNKVIASLKQASFAGARTTAMLARELNFDPFRMPTSVHVFPHSRFEYFRNLARAWDLRRAWAYATHLRCADNWVDLAKILFDSVLKSGGLWHLYGHAWEIEELGLWNGLKEVLDYVSHRPGVLYLPNGAVVGLPPDKRIVAEYSPEPILDSLRDSSRVQAAPQRRMGI